MLSSERRAKSEMEKSRRKLELGDDEPDMVEIGKEILDSEDTDPEDDVPLASLQPVLVSLQKWTLDLFLISFSGQFHRSNQE